MPNQLRFTTRARGDLREIGAYVAKDNPIAAAHLVAAIKAACYRLSLNPMIGKGRPEYGEGVRSFPVRSRLIIYHPDNNVGSVTILRVIHGARDIEQAVQD
jgi:toxin ParE1/3/4